ncbi:MAG: PQQ-dependent sugar dehydrogenase [Candidatus Nanopelagicales bacterium]
MPIPDEQVVARRLAAPWGLAFLPDGSALVTVRDTAEVLRVGTDREPEVLGRVDGVAHGGEGGLLGIAVSPTFAQDDTFYVYHTTQRDNRVQRMRLKPGSFVAGRVVVDGIPRAGTHNGGRIAFGPDGYLYVTTGDAGVTSRSQDPDSLGGKIMRLAVDGSPAPGNPDQGSPVWSRGHRNVQGIGWDASGRMFASEFGQDTWDELNIIRTGRNYGWPLAEGRGGGGGLVDPIVTWRTADASPSGIAVVGTGDGGPTTVLVAALRGRSLWRVDVDGRGEVLDRRRLLVGRYGRLRAVEVGPDGRVWLLTSNTSRGDPEADDDRVIVLAPDALG